MAKLILISGKAEHGKSYTGKIIKNKLEQKGKKVAVLPFASYLKFLCKEHFGWNGIKDENGRRILQYVGTDIVRKRNPNFWVKTVADFVETFGEDFDFIICDDARFRDELDYFRYNLNIDALSIRVNRLDFENSLTPEQRKHSSETALDGYDFDLYISCKNGIDNLRQEVENRLFLNQELLSWLYE